MTLDEIKAAVLAGRTVHWCNDSYTVLQDLRGSWYITFRGDDCIALTWNDGVTLSGRPSDFYEATS